MSRTNNLLAPVGSTISTVVAVFLLLLCLNLAEASHGYRRQMGQMRQMAQKAYEHGMRINEEAQCGRPRPELVYLTDSNKIFLPRATILHRCSDLTGCCAHSTHSCQPSASDQVNLYFFTISVQSTSRVRQNQNIEVLSFVNHTECSCIPVDRMRSELISQPNISTISKLQPILQYNNHNQRLANHLLLNNNRKKNNNNNNNNQNSYQDSRRAHINNDNDGRSTSSTGSSSSTSSGSDPISIDSNKIDDYDENVDENVNEDDYDDETGNNNTLTNYWTKLLGLYRANGDQSFSIVDSSLSTTKSNNNQISDWFLSDTSPSSPSPSSSNNNNNNKVVNYLVEPRAEYRPQQKYPISQSTNLAMLLATPSSGHHHSTNSPSSSLFYSGSSLNRPLVSLRSPLGPFGSYSNFNPNQHHPQSTNNFQHPYRQYPEMNQNNRRPQLQHYLTYRPID